MNIKETRATISKIFNYIERGVEKTSFGDFYGHPGLYFFHTKEEFAIMLDKCLDKESYDRYDIYYIVEKLIKFLLDKYDSHTKLYFKNSIYFPISFKIQDNDFYIVNIIDEYKDVVGGKLVSINNIPVEKIVYELEQIINYSTEEYKNIMLTSDIEQLYILRSLPSINNNIDKITYQINRDGKIIDVSFKETERYDKLESTAKENYTYEKVDDILIIHYNSCKDIEKMEKLVEKVKTIENDINYYIVDIRNNSGGFSNINHILIDFLTGKSIVTLINEAVFSSGRMMLVDLKKIGSYVIGTNISTSLNAFGNVPGGLEVEKLDLIVKRSNTYWYYDENLRCQGFTKDNFSSYFKDKKELLKPKVIEPDEYVYNTVDDIINNKDSQLERAIEYIKLKKQPLETNKLEGKCIKKII